MCTPLIITGSLNICLAVSEIEEVDEEVDEEEVDIEADMPTDLDLDVDESSKSLPDVDVAAHDEYVYSILD